MENLDHQLLRQRETCKGFFWHRLRWESFRDALRRRGVRSVVDIGAGSGLFADLVAQDFPGARYCFVETSAALLPYLERAFGGENNLSSSATYAQADAAIMLDVLEHLDDDRALLEEAARKMRPGMPLVVTVPAMNWLWSRWDLRVGHRRRYSKADLAALFKTLEGHFKVLELRYLFWELIPLGLFRKWKMRNLDVSQGDPMAEAEVPELPRWINAILYGIGKLAMPLGRWMPAGTTLLLIAEKR